MNTGLWPATDVEPREAAAANDAERRLEAANHRVWIDQDLCTGDGLCSDTAPSVFVMLEDGIAYVRELDRVFNDPGQSSGQARVDPRDEDAVIAAALECPGECIFIEPVTHWPARRPPDR